MTRGEFQCRTRLCGWCSLAMEILTGEIIDVSMPHAALWVVQQEDSYDGNADWEFQCRTRLCGWCSTKSLILVGFFLAFQCRTRLCGWCSFVALSSCPPKRKKAFWKVSGNLRCLTENI